MCTLKLNTEPVSTVNYIHGECSISKINNKLKVDFFFFFQIVVIRNMLINQKIKKKITKSYCWLSSRFHFMLYRRIENECYIIWWFILQKLLSCQKVDSYTRHFSVVDFNQRLVRSLNRPFFPPITSSNKVIKGVKTGKNKKKLKYFAVARRYSYD